MPTRLIVVGILMSIALMSPFMYVTSHNPLASIDADVQRHLILGAQISEHSTHSHHNGTPAESAPDHQHGHNGTDHTHNFAFLSARSTDIMHKLGLSPCSYQRNYLSHTSMQWQRPPRYTQLS